MIEFPVHHSVHKEDPQRRTVTSMTDETLLDEAQAAAALGVTTGVMRRWRRSKIGPPYQETDAGPLYDADELTEWAGRLSDREVAIFLDMSDATLRKWRQLHKGPPYHKVGRIRYSLHDLIRWQESKRIDPEKAE